MSKAAFVRTFPKDTPASEIIAAGKKKGIKLTAPYIYVIRSKDAQRKAGKKANGRGKDYLDGLLVGSPGLEQRPASPPHMPSNDEAVFLDIVRRKGTEWATQQLGGL